MIHIIIQITSFFYGFVSLYHDAEKSRLTQRTLTSYFIYMLQLKVVDAGHFHVWCMCYLWILCSTRCLCSGRRWCGKSFISSCCENALPQSLPLLVVLSRMDVSIYLMHCGLKSPCITSVLSQVLSCQKCMKAPLCTLVLTWCAEGCLQPCL